MLVTPAEFRDVAETDIPDGELARLLEAQEQLIVGRFGGHDAHTEQHAPDHLTGRLWLSRKAASITEVRERASLLAEEVTVDPADYRLAENGHALLRLRGAWGQEVTVVYTPKVDLAVRRQAVIDLAKLAIEFSGLETTRAGDLSETVGDLRKRREQVLAPLAAGRRMVA